MSVFLHGCLSTANGYNARFAFASIYKSEIARVAGIDSSFLRALDHDNTRSTLDDLSAYDAFRYGFPVLPALDKTSMDGSYCGGAYTHSIHWKNSLATLPGHEDAAGLTALLDPTTLPGRLARINLLTRGSNAMFLAMTPLRSPCLGTVKEHGTEKGILPDAPVIAS